MARYQPLTPPKHTVSEEQFNEYFLGLGSRFIAGGNWNAKHQHWGSRLTILRGRQLINAIWNNGLHFHSTDKPTYWSTDTNKKTWHVGLLHLQRHLNYNEITPCSDLSSDHSPIILTISTLVIKKDVRVSITNWHTDWEIFQQHINNKINLRIPLKTEKDIEKGVELLNKTIHSTAWISTPIRKEQDMINDTYP